MTRLQQTRIHTISEATHEALATAFDTWRATLNEERFIDIRYQVIDTEIVMFILYSL